MLNVNGIEKIKVGERVLTNLPDKLRELAIGDVASIPEWDRLEADVDPKAWRRLELEMTTDDHDRFEIVLLRPVAWVDESDAHIGGTIHLVLDEQGLDGPAKVIAIEPCPPISSQPGRVVTGTFTHIRGGILTLRLAGIDEPIGITKNHSIYSVDRNEFVHAGDLEVGEELQHLGGITRIASIERLPEEQRVYNLEVHAEHVYRVTSDGVLVHNNCADELRVRQQRERRRLNRERESREVNGQNQSGDGYRDHESANKGPRGERPKGPGGKNRERNIGIDEEHSRVAKGTGGGQGGS